jgi:hypothetical protein
MWKKEKGLWRKEKKGTKLKEREREKAGKEWVSKDRTCRHRPISSSWRCKSGITPWILAQKRWRQRQVMVRNTPQATQLRRRSLRRTRGRVSHGLSQTHPAPQICRTAS